MADLQWGSGGAIDYRREALKVIGAIRAEETDPQSRTLTLGNWIDRDCPQWGGVRSSDFMPAHLKAFASAASDPYWTGITDTSYRLLSQVIAQFSPTAGLAPDFIACKEGVYRPAPPKFLEGANDGRFSYNACRVPWRVGTDALLTGDPRALALLKTLNHWMPMAANGDSGKVNAGYQLDGKPLREDSSAAFIGPLAVAAMLDPAQQAWLNTLWTDLLARHPADEDYFANSIKLLTMIVITGNWWQPL